jgi:hypothetical protein
MWWRQQILNDADQPRGDLSIPVYSPVDEQF